MSMWRPPERIKYSARPGQWPTVEQAAASRLFSTVRVGSLELRARTWVPAMVPWRASDDGFVTPAVLAWYRRFAEGRPAALVVEATGIRDVPSGPLLRIGHDRFVPGLEELVRVVHSASAGETRVLIQLIDFLAIRRRPDPSRFLGEFLMVTDEHRERLSMIGAAEAEVREHMRTLPESELGMVLTPREFDALQMGHRERVTDLHLPHVRELPAVLPTLFAEATSRAQRAGFDGVELHYAHAYTMASFLSALNDRADGYGGARSQRVRLPLEVFRAVRSAVGSTFPVGCRLLADECIAGGSDVEDAQYFALQFARAGIDFISLSRGGKFEDALRPKVGQARYPYTGPSGYECMPSYYSDARGPFGRNNDAATRIREDVRAGGYAVPIIAGGGIHNFEQAESLLERGSADIVSLARQALADPDWFRKVRAGRGQEVRLCLYTNYCEALDQQHREVTCELWDRDHLDEPDVARSKDGKRRLGAPAWSEEACRRE